MKKTTLVIENVQPLLNCGRYPVKRVAGQTMRVSADVFKDGHDAIAVMLQWRQVGTRSWREIQMLAEGNDVWSGVFPLEEVADYEFTIEAWPDSYASWREEISRKSAGGANDLSSEALEGAQLLKSGAKRAGRKAGAKELGLAAEALAVAHGDATEILAAREDLAAWMAAYPDRTFSTKFRPWGRVTADRALALFGAWYEFFPRSAGGDGSHGSTFRDCLARLDDAKAMGFDIIYFPPIHPIGQSKRKGRNNSLVCQPDDPGVPYAIGNRHQGCPHGGGHLDVAPELGTLEDFVWLVGQAKKRGLEIALDFALNCSPDHPYVADHPEWFFHRPDGSIKYAENPPKKYEDVYPIDYHNAAWSELWEELKNVILWWAGHGVRTFRVDNPHTKPVAFWEWLMTETRKKFPDLIFLSEAFTKPKMMHVLAKAGFTQSYTYFTWRNTKPELIEYFTELTTGQSVDYFRPNLFPNTPDILPFFLQQGGRPAFMIRAVLAATLSPVYGIYSGFELGENAAIPGREEYLDSEKYQHKSRDWNGPGNIKDLVTKLNRIRKENRALQELTNLRFLPAENDQILFYAKVAPAMENILLVVVTLDPWNQQSAWVEVPVNDFGLGEDAPYQVHDLLTDERFLWRGPRNFVVLDPQTRPAHVFRLSRRIG